MAVIQHKNKVRPVMDYRELNEHVNMFMGNADVCVAKLRELCKKGANVLLLDLRRVYLQFSIDKSLWPYQTKGQKYHLKQLGFGLNMASLIVRSIVDTVMFQDQTIKSVMSEYIDIFVNKNLVSTARVRKHLFVYGFICKDPE